MTTNSQTGSARIYEFPVRGRFAASGARDDAKSAADMAAARIPKVAFGSGWYHEAAVQEAEQAGKR
jgi:hypothetical protein